MTTSRVELQLPGSEFQLSLDFQINSIEVLLERFYLSLSLSFLYILFLHYQTDSDNASEGSICKNLFPKPDFLLLELYLHTNSFACADHA